MEMEIDLRPWNFVRLLVDVQVQEWPHIEAKKGQDLKAHWSIYAIFQVISEPEVKKMMAGFMILRKLNVKLSNILELEEMLIGIKIEKWCNLEYFLSLNSTISIRNTL